MSWLAAYVVVACALDLFVAQWVGVQAYRYEKGRRLGTLDLKSCGWMRREAEVLRGAGWTAVLLALVALLVLAWSTVLLPLGVILTLGAVH